jgi:hypothetical protein
MRWKWIPTSEAAGGPHRSVTSARGVVHRNAYSGRRWLSPTALAGLARDTATESHDQVVQNHDQDRDQGDSDGVAHRMTSCSPHFAERVDGKAYQIRGPVCLGGVSLEDQAKLLHVNTAKRNERRPG